VRRRSNLKLTEYLSIVVSDILQSTRSRSIHDIEGVAIAKIKELTHDVPSLIVTDKRQPRSREREGLWWNGRTIKELLPLSSAAGAALQPVSRGQGVRARKPRRA
jgi:hypothetical protein